jgi:hypothetical protein
MPALLHLASHGVIVVLHVTGRPKERELDGSGVVAILSSLVPMAYQIFLFFLFLSFFFFSLVKETKLISLLSCTQNLPRWHLLIVMHCGSVFRIEFSYTDRVRHNFAQIGSFSKFSIFRKFASVFVSGFTVFAFVFVFKYKSRKWLRCFPTVSDRFHP